MTTAELLRKRIADRRAQTDAPSLNLPPVLSPVTPLVIPPVLPLSNHLSDLCSSIASMSPDQLDALDVGVIQCTDSGKILFYNKAQAEFAKRSPEDVQGQNFFTEVAICCSNPLFYGAFKRGISTEDLDIEFNYAFTFRVKPTLVRVRLYRDASTRTNWILIKPL